MPTRVTILLAFCFYCFACSPPTDIENKPIISFKRFSPEDTVQPSGALDVILTLKDIDANTERIKIKKIYPDIQDTSDFSIQNLPSTSTLSLDEVDVIVKFINANVDNEGGGRLTLTSGNNLLRNYNLQFMIWAEDAASNLSDSILTPTIFIKTR